MIIFINPHPTRSPKNKFFIFCLQLAAPLQNIIFAAWYILCTVYKTLTDH